MCSYSNNICLHDFYNTWRNFFTSLNQLFFNTMVLCLVSCWPCNHIMLWVEGQFEAETFPLSEKQPCFIQSFSGLQHLLLALAHDHGILSTTYDGCRQGAKELSSSSAEIEGRWVTMFFSSKQQVQKLENKTTDKQLTNKLTYHHIRQTHLA